MKRNPVLLAAFLALACGLAAAQSRYQCPGPNGYVNSTTPCAGGDGGLVMYGPTETPATQLNRYQNNPQPRVEAAPPVLRYMSARCSSLNDGVRTGAARGLSYDSIYKLRREYEAQCGDEEREAYKQMGRERQGMAAQQKEAAAQSDAERARASLKAQQCGESKRILNNKKARTDLTEGEKADLQRFEDNYRARCT